MNHQTAPKNFAARRMIAALALFIFISNAFARSTPDASGRWLLVFGTSSAMKKYLPATEAELKSVFAASFDSEMKKGDSIGVWTFDRKLHAGQFPLTTWIPQFAVLTASNLTAFLHDQHYSRSAKLAALEPSLNSVIDSSPRLTVVIFCDGRDELHFTPYADAINRTMAQLSPQQKNLKQPFVIVLRTQLGRFVGATVNLPPGALELPVFPPLPEPKKATAAAAPAAPTNSSASASVKTPPAKIVPPLIIVGTNVGTNINDLPKLPPPVPAPLPTAKPATNAAALPNPVLPPPKVNPVISTSAPVSTSTTAVAAPVETEKPKAEPAAVSNAPAASAEAVAPVESTNLIAASTTDEKTDAGARRLISIGVGLLVVAVLLVIAFAIFGRRPPRGSLITRSMQNDSRPPSPKTK